MPRERRDTYELINKHDLFYVDTFEASREDQFQRWIMLVLAPEER